MANIQHIGIGLVAVVIGAAPVFMFDSEIHHFVVALSVFATLGVVYLFDYSSVNVPRSSALNFLLFFAVALLIAFTVQSSPSIADSFSIGFGIGLIAYALIPTKSTPNANPT